MIFYLIKSKPFSFSIIFRLTNDFCLTIKANLKHIIFQAQINPFEFDYFAFSPKMNYDSKKHEFNLIIKVFRISQF
jgi:hypothetical protein